jgi:hypothetical protein
VRSALPKSRISSFSFFGCGTIVVLDPHCRTSQLQKARAVRRSCITLLPTSRQVKDVGAWHGTPSLEEACLQRWGRMACCQNGLLEEA